MQARLILVLLFALTACAPPATPTAPAAAIASQPMTQVIATTAPTPQASPTPAPTATQPTPAAGVVAVAPRQASLPTAAPATNVIDYFPQRPDSPAQPGACWTNSQVVPSRAAWRCEAGKQTLDPCFPVGDGQHVVCEPNPLLGRPGALVRLSEPLPQPDLLSERVNPAWLLQLADGAICRLTPGVTGMIGDKRITYRCAAASGSGGDVVILGEPRPGTTWQAERVVLPATGGQPDPAAVATVSLLAVVRGPALYAPAACQTLADDLALLFGGEVNQSQAAFTDPLTGQIGQACQITATAPARLAGLPAATLLRKLLADSGWREDSRYTVEKAGLSTFAFRGGDTLCLAQVTGAPDAAGVMLSCGRNIALAATAPPAAQRSQEVLFAAGATAATVRQPWAAGQIRAFSLRTLPGQTLILEAPATAEAVALAVYRAGDGGRLTPASVSATRWQAALPDGGVVVVKVAARRDVTDWTLRIIVPVDLTLAPGKALKQNGIVEPGEIMYYLTHAPAGQRARITLTSPMPGISLEIVTVEGSPILAVAAGQTAWAGLFPAGPRGLIQVAGGGQQAEYTLEVVGE